jgi:hypothetical protein
MTDLNEERIKRAGIVPVVFPACCLSCKYNEDEDGDRIICQLHKVEVDVFSICNGYKELE